LRLGQIFCSISAFCKFRNTKSIPKFTKLELKQNLLPKPSKIYFSGYLRLDIASPNIITQVFPKVKQIFHLFQTFLPENFRWSGDNLKQFVNNAKIRLQTEKFAL
jgi:hypothetical protein